MRSLCRLTVCRKSSHESVDMANLMKHMTLRSHDSNVMADFHLPRVQLDRQKRSTRDSDDQDLSGFSKIVENERYQGVSREYPLIYT
jgi:hypothetical protein